MVDRIEIISGEKSRGKISAERDVRLDDWFFQCHFLGDPVQPGCLGLDGVWQLLGFYCNWRGGARTGRALGCGEVEFFGQIRPHDGVMRYEIHVKRYTELKNAGASMVIGDAQVLDRRRRDLHGEGRAGRALPGHRLSRLSRCSPRTRAAGGWSDERTDRRSGRAPSRWSRVAAPGIGAACCRRLAAEGFRVGIHYRSSEEKAQKLAAELEGRLHDQGRSDGLRVARCDDQGAEGRWRAAWTCW